MKLKEKMKRFAAAVLSMTMALTCMSLCALAEEIATPAEPSATEVIVLPVEDSSEDSAAQEAPPETDTETPPMEAHEPSVPEDAANEPIQPDAEAEPRRTSTNRQIPVILANCAGRAQLRVCTCRAQSPGIRGGRADRRADIHHIRRCFPAAGG